MTKNETSNGFVLTLKRKSVMVLITTIVVGILTWFAKDFIQPPWQRTNYNLQAYITSDRAQTDSLFSIATSIAGQLGTIRKSLDSAWVYRAANDARMIDAIGELREDTDVLRSDIMWLKEKLIRLEAKVDRP